MSEVDDTHRLAHPSLAAGDPTGWFERLYAEQAAGTAEVPWDRGTPNAALVAWADGRAGRAGRAGPAGRAVVVGCGLGRDAEFVAGLGYDTTAFDLSATAIEGARARHPSSSVSYTVADLLDLPGEWRRAFDLVVESHNVQSLPPPLHAPAAAAVAELVAPGGHVLVLAAADGFWDGTGPPWPLTRAELDCFAADGVELVDVEESEGRWRAEYRRPA